MTEGLLIIGAGGHGKVVGEAALEADRWRRIAYVDDRFSELHSVNGLPVLANVAGLAALCKHWAAAVVAVGDPVKRISLQEQLSVLGFALPVIVHPRAVVSRFAALGQGTVVFAGAVINAGASIGDACIINTGATVDHDCVLGAGVHICPGVNLGGDVNIGANSWIGIGSAVRNGIAIGANVTVGAGSVVVSGVPDNLTVFGVPARVQGPNRLTE